MEHRALFIQTIAKVGLSGLVLAACRPTVPYQSTPEPTATSLPTSKWQEIGIPMADQTIPIDLAADLYPNIGLRKLYLGVFKDIPLVNILTFWDSRLVSGVDDSNSVAAAGFEEIIADRFSPDPDVQKYFSNISVTSQQLDMVITTGDSMRKDAILKNSSGLLPKIDAIPRPITGISKALVFEPAYIKYRGFPSPAAYLPGIKFSFDNSPNIPDKAA